MKELCQPDSDLTVLALPDMSRFTRAKAMSWITYPIQQQGPDLRYLRRAIVRRKLIVRRTSWFFQANWNSLKEDLETFQIFSGKFFEAVLAFLWPITPSYWFSDGLFGWFDLFLNFDRLRPRKLQDLDLQPQVKNMRPETVLVDNQLFPRWRKRSRSCREHTRRSAGCARTDFYKSFIIIHYPCKLMDRNIMPHNWCHIIGAI